jgi:hypothetical protein
LVGIVLPVLYAVGGLLDAVKKGEAVRWSEFAKTIVVGLVAAGLISTQTADMIVEVVATQAFTYVADKILNAIIRKKPA